MPPPTPAGAPAPVPFCRINPVVRGLLLAALLLPAALLAREARRPFAIPAGDATTTLAEFARQTGEQLAYLVDQVRGQQTRAVEGRTTPAEALRRMLAGTSLTLLRDPATGAMTVVRRTEPPPRPPERPPLPASPPGKPPRDDEVVTLAEFTVSSTTADRYRAADAISSVRVRTALLNTPASVSVLTRDLIDDLAPTRLYDVTRYLAGIEEGRGIQFSDRQIIRGFESNGRTVDNFFQTGADNFDEALIERIEVSKGPNAILAPAGVPGGSINVITKSPSFTPRRTLTALAGLFDAQKATLDATGPLGDGEALAYRFVGAMQDSRRYWADDARLRGKVFAPMLTWQVSDRTQLTFKLIGAEHWIFRDPGLILDPATTYASDPPRLAPGFFYRSRNGVQPWSHVGTQTWDAFALLTTTFADRLSLRVALNGRHYYEDSTQVFFSTPTLANRYHPATGELTQDHTWAADPVTGAYVATYAPFFNPTAIPVRADTQETTITTFNGQADLAATTQVGGAVLQTVGGLAFNHADTVGRLRNGTLPPIDLTRPWLRAEPVWSPDLYMDNRAKQNTMQAYLSQRVSLLGDRVQLLGGMMHYGVYSKARNQLDRTTAPSVLDDTRALWQGAVLLKPRPDLSIYYTRSTNSTPVIANDLPLWRDGRQDEIGLKTELFAQRLAVNLAWFRIRQSNVSVPNPERQTDPSAPEQLISDLGDRGFELEVNGGLTPSLSVIAAYTELRLRDSLGRPVRAVADRNAALLLNYHRALAGERRLSLSLGLTHAGARPGDTTAVNFTPLGVATKQSFRIPAQTTANLGAAYRHGRWQVRLNVDNLLDARDRLRTAGGRVTGTGLGTASGRNLKLSTSLDF